MQGFEVIGRRQASVLVGASFVLGILLGAAVALFWAQVHRGQQLDEINRAQAVLHSWLDHLASAEPDVFGDLAATAPALVAATGNKPVSGPAVNPATSPVAQAQPQESPQTTPPVQRPAPQQRPALAQAPAPQRTVPPAHPNIAPPVQAASSPAPSVASGAASAQAVPAPAPVPVPAPASAPADAPAAVAGASPVVRITLQEANIAALSGQSVQFRSGRVVERGELFPSGERLVNVVPSEGKIVTDRRTIILTAGN